MMVETVCGVLSGGPFASNIRKWQNDPSVANLVGINNPSIIQLICFIYIYYIQGQTFVALDPNCFAPGFEEQMQTFMDEMRQMDPVRTMFKDVNRPSMSLLCT